MITVEEFRTEVREWLADNLVGDYAALKGLGIAILREYLVFNDLRAGTLVRLLDNYRLDRRALYVVRPKDRHPPARMRLFIDYLSERMKDYAKDLSQPTA